MKKICALMLAFVMLLPIASCTVPSEEGSEKSTTSSTESMSVTEIKDRTETTESASNTETSGQTESDSNTEESDGQDTTESNTASDIIETTEETETFETTEAVETTEATETTETEETQTPNWDISREELTYVTKYPYQDADYTYHLSYQDTYRLSRDAESVKVQEVLSFKTGTNEKDDAVIVINDDGSIYAAGVGTATVVLDNGRERDVVVHASPLNMLFLTGQSNGAGDPPDSETFVSGEYQKYFMQSPNTMAYFVRTGQDLSLENAASYVPTNLMWNSCASTVTKGPDPRALTLNREQGSFIGYGSCAGLAYEWIYQTGERVWIVNASHGGQPIHCFKPSEDGTAVDNDYYQAVTVFNLALQTLYAEVDAGHFTLNHMAYYWYQGEGDSTNTYEYYYDAFAEMHTAMQKDVVYDHGGVTKTLEYCGVFTIRSHKDDAGNSGADIYLTGPRLAQYVAVNQLEGVYENVFLVTNATESWINSDKNVEDYFLGVYGSKENFKSIFGYDMPTTLLQLKPQVHYRIFGHNEMGMDAARNSLRILNYLNPDNAYKLTYEPDTEKPELRLVGIDGYIDITDTAYFDAGKMTTYVVPYITPSWRTIQGLSIKVKNEGFTVDGFKITCNDQLAKEMTVEIYLGGQLLETRTLKIKYSSKFQDNMPLVVNEGTAAYPNRQFHGYQKGWDAGFLTFATGAFDVYDETEENGWLYDGTGLWTGHGGFFVASGMKIGPSNNYKNVGTLGIRYTAGKRGTVKLGVDVFKPQAECDIAIFINGKQVYPSGNSNASNRNGWLRVTTDTDAATINGYLSSLTFELNEGDQVVFAVTRVDANPQVLFYPNVQYID